ncbi:MAG: transposase [Peptostreptococcaceae bacterium]|nr:transposase [Peptostreptococcaceae bacterium]
MNPAYTSQICPICGEKNKAKGRNYTFDTPPGFIRGECQEAF